MQQVFDVVESEAELLGALDEPHHSHCVVAVVPITRRSARRLGQQAAAFVITQGLAVDMRLGGDLAGLHTSTMNPTPWYPAKPTGQAATQPLCRRQIVLDE